MNVSKVTAGPDPLQSSKLSAAGRASSWPWTAQIPPDAAAPARVRERRPGSNPPRIAKVGHVAVGRAVAGLSSAFSVAVNPIPCAISVAS
jgi:hypothetical protein